MNTPLAVIGGGNMGRAIVVGAVKAALVNPECVVVAEHEASKRADMAKLGVQTAITSDEAMRMLESWDSNGVPGQVLLAVKPQSLEDLAKEVGHALADSNRIVISILAGTPSKRVVTSLGRGIRIVRAMPNLPAVVGQAATALCLGEGAMAGDEAFAETLFRGLGPVVVKTREDLMDTATGIAGSGPAYVFYLAEAMERAAMDLGFMPEDARALVRQTIIGAASMMVDASQSPTELRAMVTSKGGTTAAAIEKLDELSFNEAIVRAIVAARDRGRQLAQG
jgi:pyrroline-5-carboxylate reductase